jgi:hypothetical protein
LKFNHGQYGQEGEGEGKTAKERKGEEGKKGEGLNTENISKNM